MQSGLEAIQPMWPGLDLTPLAGRQNPQFLYLVFRGCPRIGTTVPWLFLLEWQKPVR
jgi:hypothetical protein